MSTKPKGDEKKTDERKDQAVKALEAMRVERYVDIRVAAVFLDVPVSWLYAQTSPKRAHSNKIPVRRFGKYLRFRLSELEVWRSSNGNTDDRA